MAFTAFVTDVYSRRMVGWRTTNRMPTELPLDALEMALWVRERAGESIEGLIHQSARARYTAIRHCERLGDVGAVASIGSVGDSYDNAMAESVVGLCKTTINRMITYGVKYSPPPLPSWAAKFGGSPRG